MPAVRALRLDGDQLWIGTRSDIRLLNISTMQMRLFSPAELKCSDWCEFNRILSEKDYVWVEGGGGVRRYDRQTRTWTVRNHVGLIGLIDDQLWGHLWVNDGLRDRPCIIVIRTLKITPALISARFPVAKPM